MSVSNLFSFDKKKTTKMFSSSRFQLPNIFLVFMVFRLTITGSSFVQNIKNQESRRLLEIRDLFTSVLFENLVNSPLRNHISKTKRGIFLCKKSLCQFQKFDKIFSRKLSSCVGLRPTTKLLNLFSHKIENLQLVSLAYFFFSNFQKFVFIA